MRLTQLVVEAAAVEAAAATKATPENFIMKKRNEDFKRVTEG
jgi:hypothetical protein